MRRTITAAATAALALGLVAGPAAAKPDRAGPPAVDDSIVDTAVALNNEGVYEGVFDELIFAVTALDLTDTLDTKRKFTVFAPTDAAFEAIGVEDSNGNGLVADDIVAALGADAVTDILLYHVAPGERDAVDVTTSSQVNTLNGAKIQVDGTVLDGTTNIIVPDVGASNGVIHVIDAVLLP